MIIRTAVLQIKGKMEYIECEIVAIDVMPSNER